jgi:phage-related baseplate assembly protein
MVANLVTTTPSRFSVIRPELLPTMQVLESIGTEDILARRMQQLLVIWNQHDPPNAAQYDVQNLEFDPIKINQELNTYFELMVRDRVNQACRAVTLAFAVGSDLDAIASRYPYGVPRQMYDISGNVLSPTDIAAGATVAVAETDATYRQRVWLSPNILSLSGPGQATYESYKFWALSAPQFAGQSLLRDASCFTKAGTGNVYIPIMADVFAPVSTLDPVTKNVYTTIFNSNPVPSKDQISAVYQYITAPDVARKGLTDVVSVLAPKVINTTINAKVWLYPGVDKPSTMLTTMQSVNQLVASSRWLGADLTMMSLNSALAQSGVYDVNIVSPTADITVDNSGCINVVSSTLTYMGVAE